MSEENSKKPSLLERFMLALNILTLTSLLLSYAGGFISPEKFWPLAFFAMAYPIILAAVAFFIFYWLLKRKWWIFLNISLLLFNWSYVKGSVGSITSEKANEDGFKVMTYNVRLFDKYNWNQTGSAKKRITKLIRTSNPDILCIQEYYARKGENLELLGSGVDYNTHLKNYYAQRNNQNDFGITTITAYPMINKGTVVLENSRGALTIYSDIVIAEDTVRVYNVHLQSLNLGNEGYRILDEFLESKEIEDVDESRFLLSRVKRGFLKRAVQADKISEHIKNSPYPVIVCGDFNDVPTSYAYQRIAKGLKDSFAESGKGLGATYVRVPFFRIDNILYSSKYESSSHSVYNSEPLSDHYAVNSYLNVRN